MYQTQFSSGDKEELGVNEGQEDPGVNEDKEEPGVNEVADERWVPPLSQEKIIFTGVSSFQCSWVGLNSMWFECWSRL